MSDWDIPLINAAANGDLSTVSHLLSKGKNINIQCSFGLTPLLWASMNGHERVVSLLIERGADISLKDKVRIILRISFSYLNLGRMDCSYSGL